MRTFRVALAVLVLLAACGDDDDVASDEIVVLSEDDDSTTASVAPGDTFEVRLVSCPTCGYEWRIDTAPDGAVAELTTDEYVPDDPDVDGGSGTHTFTFTALAAGTTSIELGYYPPGEDAPEETFTLTVEVDS